LPEDSFVRAILTPLYFFTCWVADLSRVQEGFYDREPVPTVLLMKDGYQVRIVPMRVGMLLRVSMICHKKSLHHQVPAAHCIFHLYLVPNWHLKAVVTSAKQLIHG
jgi:hypothetical protein